ncbi:leucine-rich repeat extensin-like protein 6 [Humulus lupulus]|uniref:leucine-rich repeat extensin-like protein 6 n=1 Tax=Humulus lupulus TaxID=3486 RepID=UPI002B40B27E|nr:leucine-rich repeat extensin-like protein 6 [Humulus lupulus]
MDSIIFFLLLVVVTTSLFSQSLARPARSSTTHYATRITVVGAVYCDTCSKNAFTKHSFFLPGVDVQIRCKFKVNSPKSAEQVNFLANKTTDRYGVYKLDIPSVDGVNCMNGLSMVSMCQASLTGTSSSLCNVPVLRTSSDEISIKSEQDNLCIYSLNALSYKPSNRNTTLCGVRRKEDLVASSLNSSKCFLPWPPLPQFKFPPLPFPTLPWPWPFQDSPSLFSPPPMPSPPAFSLTDPRTWIPFFSPSPPDRPQNQNP